MAFSPLRIAVACALLAVTVVDAQAPTLQIDQLMTVEEMRATGVATLSAPQRVALSAWLYRYTQVVISVAGGGRTGTPGGYAGVGGGHWVRSKADGGRMITLEDGSLWQVSSIDRIYTVLWLPLSNIRVIEARSPVGEFRYVLINTDDGEQALARYLGR